MPPAKSPAKKARRSMRMKIVLALALVAAAAGAAFLIRYYYLFNAAIEQKLGNRARLAETRIYAAPAVLFAGRRMSLPELEGRLRRLGYEDSLIHTDAPGFEAEKNGRLRIRNDASAPEDPGQSVEVAFAGNSIRSVRDAATGNDLERFALLPEMLSNAIEKSREKRRYISYQEMPQVLVNAVLAAEDRRFFTHNGIDPIRILQALWVDLREGEAAQGASTLTQQFVKNYFLTPERTLKRKFADAYMSLLLEKRLSKRQIFELYSNEVYLGQAGSFSIVGFGEAADAFFDKRVRDLTLEEAATLAGIITAPNRNTPLRYKDRSTSRRNLVLDLMAEYRMISPVERDEAKQKPMRVKSSEMLNYSDAPYFVDYVQDLLTARYGDAELARSKFKVYTTLDTDLEQAAFESIQAGVREIDGTLARRKQAVAPGTVQTSLIAVDPKNGHVLAMVGGRNYGASQFNRITQSKRQPGSIFKPFVYAAALETAYSSLNPLTVVSTVVDEPTKFTFENLEYEPRNFKEEYLGQVTMRQAITKSLNIATIKLAEKVGFEKVTELARRLQLNEQIKPYPAMAIGSFEISPLEMVRAYTAFANGGLLSELTPVIRILDAGSRNVAVDSPQPEQALTPQIAFLVTSLLESVIDHGTGEGARERGFVLPAAGKTGTSHDGWFAGYTPDLLCIVWVGFDDNRELGLSGSQSALPIWAQFMKKAASIRPLKGEGFAVPDGVTELEIDPTTGLRATSRCLQKERDYFIAGTEPTLECYGNNYEQAVTSGAPASIYATPKEPAAGADNKRGPRE